VVGTATASANAKLSAVRKCESPAELRRRSLFKNNLDVSNDLPNVIVANTAGTSRRRRAGIRRVRSVTCTHHVLQILKSQVTQGVLLQHQLLFHVLLSLFSKREILPNHLSATLAPKRTFWISTCLQCVAIEAATTVHNQRRAIRNPIVRIKGTAPVRQAPTLAAGGGNLHLNQLVTLELKRNMASDVRGNFPAASGIGLRIPRDHVLLQR